MPWAAALPGLIQAAGGIAGGIAGGDANRESYTEAGDAQKAAILQMIDKLDKVGMPPDQSARLILNQYQQAGILTPQLEAMVHDQISQFGNIKQNTQATNFQSDALKRMSQLGQAGITPDERAQMRQLQSQAAQQGNSAQQAIVQNLAQRGMQGSGAEIAARLGASQNASNQASNSADQVSSMAAQRALQAMASGSNLAGQMEQQNFGEQATMANAQDQMNRFNTQNQMAINQRNVAANNNAQAANLANAQNISNQNVGQNNKELYNQLDRQRQNWVDKLAYAKAYQDPLGSYGKAASAQAYGEGQARADQIAGAFGAGSSFFGGKGGQALFGSLNSSGGGNVKDMTYEDAEAASDKQRADKARGIGM